MENLSEQKMMPKKKNCLNFLKHYRNVLNKITTLKKETTIYSKFFKEIINNEKTPNLYSICLN